MDPTTSALQPSCPSPPREVSEPGSAAADSSTRVGRPDPLSGDEDAVREAVAFAADAASDAVGGARAMFRRRLEEGEEGGTERRGRGGRQGRVRLIRPALENSFTHVEIMPSKISKRYEGETFGKGYALAAIHFTIYCIPGDTRDVYILYTYIYI